jgi:hypothetical protein
MANLIVDFISRVYANIIMIILGDGNLEASTILGVVCAASIFMGIGALVWFNRPHPVGASKTTIIENMGSSEDPLTPALIMVFILFVFLSVGLIVLFLAR